MQFVNLSKETETKWALFRHSFTCFAAALSREHHSAVEIRFCIVLVCNFSLLRRSLWLSPEKQRQNGHFSDILSLYQGNTIVRAAAAVEIQFCMVLVCNSSLLSMVKWNTMPHTHENHVHHEQVGGQATIELLYSPHGPGNYSFIREKPNWLAWTYLRT